MKFLDRLSLTFSTFGILLSGLVMFVAIVANDKTLTLVSFAMIVVLLIISGRTIRRQP